MDMIREILHSADTGLVYPVGALLVALSALFPPIPSTTVFVGLGALAVSAHSPNAFLLALSMLAGAVAGDLATYWLARRHGLAEWKLFRAGRWHRALDAARQRLESHAPSLVLTSRFIPLGRLTMNLASASIPLPLPRFTAYSVAAGLLWSGYSVGIGAVSGSWPHLRTEFAVLIAIAVSLVVGRIIGTAASWFLGRRAGVIRP